jgi:membrane associated rhomboid family serine protease
MSSKYTEIKRTLEREESKNNIEVWEDIVSIKDLVISLIICSFTALGGYFLAPNKPPKPLLFGLSGAIIGFVICSIFIKPKRVLIVSDRED